jgi:uncharacterized protein YcbK (DUF882 family)
MTYMKPSETCCSCGCGFDITDLTRQKFDALRTVFGGPLTVCGPARCPSHNAKVGGAKQSRHMSGDALDISIAGWGMYDVVRLAALASKMGANGIGVGINRGILHIDFRPGPVLDMWHY